MPRLRLLPVVIAACAIAAPLYAGNMAGLFALAAAQPAPTPRIAAAEPSVPAGSHEPGFTDLLSVDGGLGATPTPVMAAGTCSPALADMLAAERKALDVRAAEIDLMATWLEAAERRTAEQVAALETVRAEVTALVDRRQIMAEADMVRMVAIYGNMKPKDAARLLNGTETEIVVGLLDRMEERRAAPILAEMEPAKVNALTRSLTTRHQFEGDHPPTQSAEALPLTIAPRM